MVPLVVTIRSLTEELTDCIWLVRPDEVWVNWPDTLAVI